MKLNSSKYTFGITVRKFFGFMVTWRGIEVSPEKIQAILDMRYLTSKKEVQLTRRVTTLSRFILKSVGACRSLRTYRRCMVSIGEECRHAFEDLKSFLASPHLLSKLEVGVELYLYLAASLEVVSSILVQVDDKGLRKTIYYTNRVLYDVETRYSKSKKIVFALISLHSALGPVFKCI